jgi:hypothetical protein
MAETYAMLQGFLMAEGKISKQFNILMTGRAELMIRITP